MLCIIMIYYFYEVKKKNILPNKPHHGVLHLLVEKSLDVMMGFQSYGG